ncbi:MAG TPA: tRNA (adenosine(37)-N6)-threonylcarbamoyltransferase complex dimerization subunit type 1 TsaB [Gemmatimonadaceae bacterium]|nr:tRNA (adenosine(37)-N6)-threonylcarbamoyltransferase complex dimerization subunit type 1 TsaB [Gemmatimonadaceae bacterium]
MTPLTIALDASTYTGSVALLRGGVVLASRDAAMRGEREERLLPAVADAMKEAGARPEDIQAVVCGAGPGSFTSLRIAASIAKGVAMASGASFSCVSSLALMVAAAIPVPGRYLAALDAMREELYVSLVEVAAGGIVVAATRPEVITAALLEPRATRDDATPLGPGLRIDSRPQAAALARIAPALVTPVSLASWEPQYGRLAEAQVKWEATHGRPLLAR